MHLGTCCVLMCAHCVHHEPTSRPLCGLYVPPFTGLCFCHGISHEISLSTQGLPPAQCVRSARIPPMRASCGPTPGGWVWGPAVCMFLPNCSVPRIFRWSASRLFPLGIRVNVKELEKAKATMAKHPGNLVLLPTHRSHIDYLTMHHICALYNLPTPCVVAGDNLNMAVIGVHVHVCKPTHSPMFFGATVHHKPAVFRIWLSAPCRHTPMFHPRASRGVTLVPQK